MVMESTIFRYIYLIFSTSALRIAAMQFLQSQVV